MDLTENERLMLIKKKENICGATLKILSIADDPKNLLEIKKGFSMILSLLSSIASYSDSKNYNLNEFTNLVDRLFSLMEREKGLGIWITSPRVINYLCNRANSVKFNFKGKFKITLPKIDAKIDLSLFKTG